MRRALFMVFMDHPINFHDELCFGIIKISNEEYILLRIKIDDSQAEQGIIIFDMYDTKLGTRVFKFKFENDKLIILENPSNIDVDIEQLKEKFEELMVQSNPKQIFFISSLVSILLIL